MRRGRLSAGWITVEFVVASLIALLLIAATLEQLGALGRAQRRALVRGGNSQAARAALTIMRRSISSAGLAVRRPADAGHGDEGIEGAWSGALIVRGDVDRSTADASSPEQSLAGDGSHDSVSTGNDEIVAWFLGSGQIAAGIPDELMFFADVLGVPRDASKEEVIVDRVAIDQLSPPHTLYRAHVRDDSVVTTRRPIIDGVTRLQFAYFDDAGRPIAAPGGGEDAAAREARGRIRSIAVSLEIDGEADAPRESGEASQRWRMVITPVNLGFHSRSES